MKDTTGSQVTVENILNLLWEQIQKYVVPKISSQAWGSCSQAAGGPGAFNMHYPASGPHNLVGGYGGYYVPPTPQAPVIIMQHTPWGDPDGSWYPSGYPSQPTTMCPQADSSCSTSSAYSITMTCTGTCTQTSIDNFPDAKTPKIIGWFVLLD